MSKIFNVILIGVIGAIVGAIFLIGASFLGFLGSIDIFRSPTGTVTSTQSVVQSVRPLGQLTTISAQFATADIRVNVRWGVLNACGVTAHHTAQGTIEAGVDLTRVSDANLNYNTLLDRYTIRLPQPAITNCIIDPISTRQYSISGRTPACWVQNDELRRIASYEAIHQFREDAIESGVLERAAQQTEILLVNFISSLTGSDVVINYEESDDDEITFPPSCRPSFPGVWRPDEENPGRWVKD